jgi:hypothetical protein
MAVSRELLPSSLELTVAAGARLLRSSRLMVKTCRSNCAVMARIVRPASRREGLKGASPSHPPTAPGLPIPLRC